jgi:hypothetical protein
MPMSSEWPPEDVQRATRGCDPRGDHLFVFVLETHLLNCSTCPHAMLVPPLVLIPLFVLQSLPKPYIPLQSLAFAMCANGGAGY